MNKKISQSKVDSNPTEDEIQETIDNLKKENPLIGATIGAKEITQILVDKYQTDEGIHLETLLTAISSLAGYACQASVRAEFVESENYAEEDIFVTAQGEDGKTYYFGDYLNHPLVDGEYSIWSLVAGAAQHLGDTKLIDLNSIFEHVAETVGSPEFGVPRIPYEHMPSELPINYVKSLWEDLLPKVKVFCDSPFEWPILFGIAAQDIVLMGKDVIDSKTALTIIMESAVPMSKIDLHG